jgi:hypothetical protein
MRDLLECRGAGCDARPGDTTQKVMESHNYRLLAAQSGSAFGTVM